MYLESIYNENILVNINDLNKFLKKDNNINNYLLLLLKNKIGNKCNVDGLVITDTINIIYRDCGKFLHNDKILYKLKFNTKILFPTEGCILNNCKIIFISSILYIAKLKSSNLIIILPRNFMKTSIDIKKNKFIDIVCIDKYYELNDRFMFIIGIPYYDKIMIEKITENSNDDINCRNIYKNITEFKESYEQLFSKLKTTDDDDNDEFLIDYEVTQQSYGLNNILKELINILDIYIESNNKTINYTVDTKNLNNYFSIFNIYDLLNIKIKSLTNFNIYTNYDLYNTNKNKLQYNNFIKTNNSNTLYNSYTYCYITSTIQALKNSKLFLKMYFDFFDSNENNLDKNDLNYKLYSELNKLFNNSIDSVDNLINILEKYNLDFNFSNLNSISDFINLLFSLLDNIDNTLYIKNVYDDININTKSIKQIYNENTIGFYINNLNISNNKSVLNKFYNINVNEYKCSTCLFRYYHIQNKLINTLNLHNNNSLSKCIHSLNMNPVLVDGLQCNICNNSTIYKSSYLYVNPTDYLICDINRALFEETLDKNRSELFINNRINIKTININSTNYIKMDNNLLDLKSIIYHVGTFSNGHYICLNKTSSDYFYLYDDNSKYIVTNDNFYTNSLFKSNICNAIYQINNINSPLSDILLLNYENDYLNENTNLLFNSYIKNNNEVGINIKTQITGGAQVTNIINNDNILVRLYNLNLTKNSKLFIDIINKFFDNKLANIKLISDELIISTLTEYFNNNSSTILPNYNNLYKLLVNKYVENLKNLLINKKLEPMEFLNGTNLFNTIKNIYIGSSGYNTNKTNHWDVVYEISNNNLELYSNHFNTVEINDTYYNEFDKEYYIYLEDKLSELEDNLALSLIFNKELSDVIVNKNELNIDEINEKINITFNKYYENISIIDEFIYNLVFIFESDFIYTENNFNNLKLLSNLFNKLEANIIYEFHDNSWFNNIVAEYLIENNITIATLIINNNNNDYGYNLINNLDYIQQYNFPINYIKLYGSINKFNGSHSEDLLLLINFIMHNNKSNDSNIKKLTDLNNSHFIYFNNIETDLDNKRYKKPINDLDINTPNIIIKENTEEPNTEEDTIEKKENSEVEENPEVEENNSEELTIEETLTDNINIPSAVFDAKCLYKLLEKLNNLKK